MPPWCHRGSFALSLGSHLGASSKSSSLIFGPSRSSLDVPHVCTLCHCGLIMAILLNFWLTLLVFCGSPQWSYSMQVWCHLGNLAFSLSIFFCANSKSSCFFHCAILVFSGGHPCLYSMPVWSHIGNLALSLSSHLGLLWGPPMFLLHATLVPSWQFCFVFG